MSKNKNKNTRNDDPHVLYLTHQKEDYLQDQVLLGMKKLLGKKCVDYPKKEVLYKSCDMKNENIYGRGFSVWKNMEDMYVDRSNIREKIEKKYFDIIVFGSIQRQKSLFEKMRKGGYIKPGKISYVFLDGEDILGSKYERKLERIAKATKNFLSELKIIDSTHRRKVGIRSCNIFGESTKYGIYFKREMTKNFKNKNEVNRALPISFSIPSEKIRREIPNKKKMFTKQVQCKEAYDIKEVEKNSVRDPVFEKENNYYKDIQKSKYGITQKKGGWECMRHYEIAANMTVPCFHNLHQKPSLSAPHGLVDMENCISFASAKELESKISIIEKSNYYKKMVKNVRNWILKRECKKNAKRIIKIANEKANKPVC